MAGSQRFIPISTRSPAPLAPAGVLASDPMGLTSLVDPNLGGGGPGGPVGTTGATNTGEGLPGIGPTDGTAVGGGNMTFGQGLAAFGTGALNGLPGVALGNNIASAINNGDLTTSQAAQMGLQGLQFAGQVASSNPMTIAGKALMSGLMEFASQAQNSVGPTRGQTFDEATQEFSQGLRSLFGLPSAAPTALPNININDPNVKGLTDFEVTPPTPPNNRVDVPIPEAPPVPDIPDDATTPGLGQPDDGGNTGVGLGEGGDSGGVGGVWHTGGPVGGPAGQEVVGRLQGGEFVVDKDSAARFPDLIRALNQWSPGDDDGGLTSLVRRR